jgi:hypothetical protein
MRTLRFLDLEHSRATYRTDFALYGVAVVTLGKACRGFKENGSRAPAPHGKNLPSGALA